MQLSLSSFAYGKLLIGDAIRRVKELGFESIEISANRPHMLPQDYDRTERMKVRSILKDSNMAVAAIVSSSGSAHWHFTHPNQLVRRDAIGHVRNCVDLASDLETEIIEVTSGRPVIESATAKETWEWLGASLGECADYARSRGKKIGLEPEPGNFISTTSDAKKAMNEVASDSLKLLLDVGHLNLAKEDIPRSIRDAGKNLCHVHLNDNDGLRDLHLVPGKGLIDFKAILSSLKEIGYNCYLSIETMQVEPERQMIAAKSYIQSLT